MASRTTSASAITGVRQFPRQGAAQGVLGFALFYTLGMILLTIVGLAVDAAVGNFDVRFGDAGRDHRYRVSGLLAHVRAGIAVA